MLRWLTLFCKQLSRGVTCGASSQMFSVTALLSHHDNPIYYSRVTKQKHHPDVQRDVDMELEEDDDSSSRITSPGEAIASSSAVLRYVLDYIARKEAPNFTILPWEAATAHTLKTTKW